MTNKRDALLATCWAIITFSWTVTASSLSCQSPTGVNGNCVPVTTCSSLYQKLIKPDVSAEDIAFLRSSQCGYIQKIPYVCCTDAPAGKPLSRIGLLSAADSEEVDTAPGTLPTPPNCGLQLSDRIHGGTQTDLDEFPWLALIQYAKPQAKTGFHCGATLINERYVVTAAHCASRDILPDGWSITGIRLGEWNLTSDIDCIYDKRGNRDCATAHVDVGVQKVILHPQYNPRRQINDIALLRLAEEVRFNDFIKPICLPLTAEQRNEKFELAGSEHAMDVAGWGQTEQNAQSSVKLKALVHVKKLAECKEKYLRVARIQLQDTQMCAGGAAGIDTCKGDSGGPLMVPQDVGGRSYYFLAGVTSFGSTPCGLEGFPGVYTRVGMYIDWIQNSIKS